MAWSFCIAPCFIIKAIHLGNIEFRNYKLVGSKREVIATELLQGDSH